MPGAPDPKRAGAPERGACVAALGRPVHVLSAGAGPPVLLLHGTGGLGQEILAPLRDQPGVTWIAPDRPGYGYSAPRRGREAPSDQAVWIAALMDALGIGRARLVAHSLAAGQALRFAAAHPARLDGLVLVAPFCRPTPHRWMPGLRLAAAPGIGRFVRERVAPRWVRFAAPRRIAALTRPAPPPASLRDLPLRQLARATAIETSVAELRRFNAGMTPDGPPIRTPVWALVGAADHTARPGWHLPWLAARTERLEVEVVDGVGHALHHLAPERVWAAVRAVGIAPG